MRRPPSSAASTAPTSSATRSPTTTSSVGTVPPARACGTSSSSHRHQRGFARDIIRATNQPLDIKVLQGQVGSLRGAVGTPEQIADLCARYEEAGVDQVIFVAQAGRNQHEHICEGARAVRQGGASPLHRRPRGQGGGQDGAHGRGGRAGHGPPAGRPRPVTSRTTSSPPPASSHRPARRRVARGRGGPCGSTCSATSKVECASSSAPWSTTSLRGWSAGSPTRPAAIAGYRWGMEQALARRQASTGSTR